MTGWYNPFTAKGKAPREKIVAAVLLVAIVGFTVVYLQAYSQQQAQLENIREQMIMDCNKCLLDNTPAGGHVYTWETREECRGEMEPRCPGCYPRPIKTMTVVTWRP